MVQHGGDVNNIIKNFLELNEKLSSYKTLTVAFEDNLAKYATNFSKLSPSELEEKKDYIKTMVSGLIVKLNECEDLTKKIFKEEKRE